MKKIFLIIVIICFTLVSKAQYPITQNLASDSTLVRIGMNHSGAIWGNLINGSYTDTTAANLTRIPFYNGAQIISTSDTSIYARFKTTYTSRWVKMASSSGGATGSFWSLTGNYLTTIPAGYGLGTNSNDALWFKTNNTTRMVLPETGLSRQVTTGRFKYLVWDTTALTLGYSDGGSGTTPTWQQTLTAGNTLSKNDTVVMNGKTLNFWQDAENYFKLYGTSVFSFLHSTNYSTEFSIAAPIFYVNSHDSVLNKQTNLVADGDVISLQSQTFGASRYSDLTVLDTSIQINPDRGDLRIDTINYTLSTTRKKLLLRDTTTGKVENIDPSLLAGNQTPLLTISQAAAITDTINPTSWTFSSTGQKEWFGMLDEDYIMGHEGFQSSDSSAYYMKYGSIGTAGLGVLTQPGTVGATEVAVGWEMKPKAPFFGVETKIIQSFNSGSEDQQLVGIMTGRNWADANRGVIGVIFNRGTGNIILYIKKAGVDYLLTTIGITPVYPFTMGVGIADKLATIWYKDDAGYMTYTNYNISSYFDMRDTATLNSFTTFFNHFYSSGNSGFNAKISNTRWGYLKGVGLANYSPITFEDGTPLQSGGNYYLLHNAAHSSIGIDSLSIPASNAQILKWNPTSNAIGVQAKIFTERNGKLYGENSGSCVYDSTNAKWYFLIPNWGDYNGTNPVNIYKYESKYFPSGVVVLKNGVKLNLASGTTQYDPDMKKINGRWNLVYTVGFAGSGGIRRATSTDLITWTNTDSVTTAAEEGMKLQIVGGKWRVLTAVISSSTYRVRDTSLVQIGTFTPPAGLAYSGVPAHPAIIGINQQNGTTDYYWIFHDNRTFGGVNYTWGNIHFLKSNQSETGNDYGLKTYLSINNSQVGKNGYDLPNYNYTFKKLSGDAISYTAGNVGIGTLTPTRLLDVNGKSIFRDSLQATGAVRFSNYGSGIATFDASGNVSSTSLSSFTLQADTITLAEFGGGGGQAGDTTTFSTSTIYGSFFNSLSDTLVITRMQIGLQGTSPDVTITMYYNDSLNVTAGATKLVNAGNNATNIYTGTSVTSFDNAKIPPGVWVWCKTTTVTTKPTYFTLSLIGYKSRTQ